MKYTLEQKTEALKSIEDIGVSKTVEALNISAPTLYKWRNGAKSTQHPEVQEVKPDTTKAKDKKNVREARDLLENDRHMQEKITQLESENKALRVAVSKYRVALLAVLAENE